MILILPGTHNSGCYDFTDMIDLWILIIIIEKHGLLKK